MKVTSRFDFTEHLRHFAQPLFVLTTFNLSQRRGGGIVIKIVYTALPVPASVFTVGSQTSPE
jgi:hypothetical protein